MWDWLRGYFTAWDHVAATADWTEPVVQFLVTLLAGAISFFVARVTVAHQEKIAAKKAVVAEKAAAGDAVTLAFYKLIDCGEILAGMRNLLDEQFIEAIADEPYQIIRPSQGQDYPPSRVELSEVAFLSRAKDIALISDISLVYRRTINCVNLLEAYSKERIDLHQWMQNLPGYKGELVDEIASDAFPIKFKDQFERRAANLNLTITSWLEQIEDTIVLVEDVIDRLGKSSKSEFGQDFPIIQAQFPSISLSLEDIRRSCMARGIKFTL